jgi:hypothetical protein
LQAPVLQILVLGIVVPFITFTLVAGAKVRSENPAVEYALVCVVMLLCIAPGVEGELWSSDLALRCVAGRAEGKGLAGRNFWKHRRRHPALRAETATAKTQ